MQNPFGVRGQRHLFVPPETLNAVSKVFTLRWKLSILRWHEAEVAPGIDRNANGVVAGLVTDEKSARARARVVVGAGAVTGDGAEAEASVQVAVDPSSAVAGRPSARRY